MPNILLLFGCLIGGAFIGKIISGKSDFWTIFLGIGIGVAIAFSTVFVWSLLGLLVFVPFLLRLRKAKN